MHTPEQVLAILTGQKVFDGAMWHSYADDGTQLTNASGMLLRGVHGALLTSAAILGAAPRPIYGGGASRPWHPTPSIPFPTKKRRTRQKRGDDLLFLGMH